MKTGHVDILIQGSTEKSVNNAIAGATFFVEHEHNRIDFHFCTVQLTDENLYESVWYCF